MSETNRECQELADKLLERFIEHNRELYDRALVAVMQGHNVALHVTLDEAAQEVKLTEMKVAP